MALERASNAAVDGDLAMLLAGYRQVLRSADSLPPAQVIKGGEGAWLSRVPVLVTRAFLRPLVASHARQRALALERALHYEVAATGTDRSASLGALEHFRQSLPDIPTRRYMVSFLGAVLVCALLVSNVARALAPTELDEARRAMRELAGATVTVNTDALINGAEKFTLGSAIAAVVVVTLSLQFVALLPLASFRLKRILFNLYPATAVDVDQARASVERRRSIGLYELEARVFEAHDLPRPCERPVDLAAATALAMFPLLLGVLVVVAEQPRRELMSADTDLLNYVLLPAALLLLIVLPLVALNRLAEVRLDRNMTAPPERVYSRAELAPVYRRALAFVVDLVLAMTLVFLALMVMVAVGIENLEGSVLFFVLLPLGLTAVTVPFVVRCGPHAGQSLGKQLLGIRVVDASGERPRSTQAFVREGIVKSLLLIGLGALLLWIPTVLDGLSPLRDSERRSLEDRVAGTRVVRASVPIAEPAPLPQGELVAV